MKYIIVSANDRYEWEARNKLQEKVNEHLKEGWVLQGGVSTYATYGEYHEKHFADQAMIKYPTHPTIKMD